MKEKPVPIHEARHKLLVLSRILLPSCGSMVPFHLWVSFCRKRSCPCPVFSERRAKNPYTNKGKDFNWPSLTQGFPPAPCKLSGKCYWVCKEYFSEKSVAPLQHNIIIFSAHTPLISVFKQLCAQGSSSPEITESQGGLCNICHIHLKTCSAAELHNLTGSI